MNRILRRPMFRTGGTAEGITSGLSRQGYDTGLSVKPKNFPGTDAEWQVQQKRLEDLGIFRTGGKPEATQNQVTGASQTGALSGDAWDRFVKKIPEIRELSKSMSYKPRGTNVYDFMKEFGLDLASRPKAGSIFQQMATSAKGPYERFMQRKEKAAEQEYGSESDMFKTMLTSYGDILASEAEAGTSGKTYQIKVKAGMVKEAVKNIANLERRINNGEDTDGSLKEELEAERINLNNLSKDDPYVDALLGNKEYVQDFIDEIMKELEKEVDEDNNPRWTGVDLFQEAQRRFREYIQGRQPEAKGGRVGYQNAGAVMPNAMPNAMPAAMPTNQGAGPMDQGPEVPEELQNIDFETLRARLPSSITDDIVRLIANSAEAMEDFATIQTQQDINNFNKKYGVELVLPAEA